MMKECVRVSVCVSMFVTETERLANRTSEHAVEYILYPEPLIDKKTTEQNLPNRTRYLLTSSHELY